MATIILLCLSLEKCFKFYHNYIKAYRQHNITNATMLVSKNSIYILCFFNRASISYKVYTTIIIFIIIMKTFIYYF